MRELADALAMTAIAALVLLTLAATIIRVVWPPKPEIIIQASPTAMLAPPRGEIFLVLPPSMGKPNWCLPPAGGRDKKHIERT